MASTLVLPPCCLGASCGTQQKSGPIATGDASDETAPFGPQGAEVQEIPQVVKPNGNQVALMGKRKMLKEKLPYSTAPSHRLPLVPGCAPERGALTPYPFVHFSRHLSTLYP